MHTQASSGSPSSHCRLIPIPANVMTTIETRSHIPTRDCQCPRYRIILLKTTKYITLPEILGTKDGNVCPVQVHPHQVRPFHSPRHSTTNLFLPLTQSLTIQPSTWIVFELSTQQDNVPLHFHSPLPFQVSCQCMSLFLLLNSFNPQAGSLSEFFNTPRHGALSFHSLLSSEPIRQTLRVTSTPPIFLLLYKSNRSVPQTVTF